MCVGPAAQRIVPSLFTGAQGVDVKIGGIPVRHIWHIRGYYGTEPRCFQIAIYTFVSPYICVLSASSYLPVTTLHELSQWIVGTVSPTRYLPYFAPKSHDTDISSLSRVSIVDAYAIPSYIETSSRSSSSQTVRYLRTATRTSNTQSDPLPSEVQPFSPPNLLSTQTLSSSLMCLAQQVHLSPKTTLRQPTLLLLLPYPHIKRSPPRTLTHECEYRTGTRQELEDLASIWHDDALRVVYRALDVERAGVPFFADSAGKAGSGGSQTRSRQSVAENSMYI